MRLGFTASYIALWALVLFQALIALGLLQRISELRRWLSESRASSATGLAVGTDAPTFSAYDLRAGRSISSATFAGRSAVLLFLSPDCPTCRNLVTSLQSLSPRDLSPHALVVICSGEERACKIFLDYFPSQVSVLLDRDRDTWTLYDVTGPPTAVALDAMGRVQAHGNPSNLEQLRLLLHSLGTGISYTGWESAEVH